MLGHAKQLSPERLEHLLERLPKCTWLCHWMGLGHLLAFNTSVLDEFKLKFSDYQISYRIVWSKLVNLQLCHQLEKALAGNGDAEANLEKYGQKLLEDFEHFLKSISQNLNQGSIPVTGSLLTKEIGRFKDQLEKICDTVLATTEECLQRFLTELLSNQANLPLSSLWETVNEKPLAALVINDQVSNEFDQLIELVNRP